MSEWKAFCEALDFGALVPEELRRYRPAIIDALAFFLAHLSPARTLDILADQAALPAEAGTAERLAAIARRCPALHKLGQVLARDRRLPLAFRRHLQTLEAMRPARELEAIRVELESELGPLPKLGVSLDGEPLAEASVAIVTPFTWCERGERRRGVFKLLKPGIEEKLEEELELLHRIGGLLDDRCHRYGLPEIDYQDTFASVRALLAHEVHLNQEQEHLAAARPVYQALPSVIVPELYPFCTPRVTAMQRIEGRKVTDVASLSATSRRDLAALIVEAVIAGPLWSAGPATLFHADPHAGNLLVTDEGHLALLDWSLMGHLTKEDRIHLSQILLGAIGLEEHRIARAIRGLAGEAVDDNALQTVVEDHVRSLRAGQRLGLTWLTDLMDDALTQARARFGPDLVLFRRVLHMAKGVVADVSEACQIDVVLASAFVGRLLREGAPRMLAPPFCRAFATHLSNADIAQLLLLTPLTATRYWLGVQQEVLRAGLSAMRE